MAAHATVKPASRIRQTTRMHRHVLARRRGAEWRLRGWMIAVGVAVLAVTAGGMIWFNAEGDDPFAALAGRRPQILADEGAEARDAIAAKPPRPTRALRSGSSHPDILKRLQTFAGDPDQPFLPSRPDIFGLSSTRWPATPNRDAGDDAAFLFENLPMATGMPVPTLDLAAARRKATAAAARSLEWTTTGSKAGSSANEPLPALPPLSGKPVAEGGLTSEREGGETVSAPPPESTDKNAMPSAVTLSDFSDPASRETSFDLLTAPPPTLPALPPEAYTPILLPPVTVEPATAKLPGLSAAAGERGTEVSSDAASMELAGPAVDFLPRVIIPLPPPGGRTERKSPATASTWNWEELRVLLEDADGTGGSGWLPYAVEVTPSRPEPKTVPVESPAVSRIDLSAPESPGVPVTIPMAGMPEDSAALPSPASIDSGRSGYTADTEEAPLWVGITLNPSPETGRREDQAVRPAPAPREATAISSDRVNTTRYGQVTVGSPESAVATEVRRSGSVQPVPPPSATIVSPAGTVRATPVAMWNFSAVDRSGGGIVTETAPSVPTPVVVERAGGAMATTTRVMATPPVPVVIPAVPDVEPAPSPVVQPRRDGATRSPSWRKRFTTDPYERE